MDDEQTGKTPERRVHLRLRALVDDMMTQLRVTVGHDAWTPEERARAEADLARIMDNVRQEAMSRGGQSDR